MKKSLMAFAALLCMGAPLASASATFSLMDVPFTVDTLYHAKVGPGTTQTSLLFHNENTTIRAFYFTFDVGTPGVRYGGICAGDRLAGNETVSGMAKRRSKPGERYFAGVNGDFFYTSGNSAGKTQRGASILGTTLGSTVCNGTIYRAYNNIRQFAIDANNRYYIDQAVIGGSLTAPGGAQAPLAAFNAEAPAGVVTIYNDLYYGSTNEFTDDMAEVEARLADGQTLQLGRKCRMVVTGAPSTGHDMLIPDGRFVIHGRGDACCQWVMALHEGDTIEVDSRVTVNGQEIVPVELLSGLPKVLGGGQTLDTESQWYDGATQQPRGSIAFGDGGKKLYFLVVDGRSPISAGVRLRQLGDIMRYAGATEGLNIDGGGSATIYSSALGVINRPSDGTERADGNGFFAISTAPDDSTVSEIGFVDWKLELPRYGTCVPRFYGYNKYGMLIDTDLKGVKLSCPSQIGHVRADSVLVADGLGCGILTATYGGITAQLPVTVVATDALAMRCDSIITDGYRHQAVEVQGQAGGKTIALDPSALVWSSSDESVVRIGANSGVLTGVADGTATVTGTVGDFTGSVKVTVERPTAHVMPIEKSIDLATWTITQSGGSKVSADVVDGTGIKYVYTGKSARVPSIKLNKKVRLWSLPDTVRVRLNPGEAPVKSVSFTLRTPGGKATTVAVTPDTVPQNQETVFSLPTAQWTDALDPASYPITLSTIQVNMGKSVAGQQYTVLFNGLECAYSMTDTWPSAVEQVAVEPGLTVKANGTRLTLSVMAGRVEAYDTAGRLVASATSASQIDVPSAGVYVLVVADGHRSRAVKVAVK